MQSYSDYKINDVKLLEILDLQIIGQLLGKAKQKKIAQGIKWAGKEAYYS